MRIIILAIGLLFAWQMNAQGNKQHCQTVACWECVWSGELKIHPIPNVFTPNHDGINDTWVPTFDASMCLDKYHLQIFNRWGQKVYESAIFSMGWNGQDATGKLLSAGTYYYLLSYTHLLTHEEKQHKGFFELIH